MFSTGIGSRLPISIADPSKLPTHNDQGTVAFAKQVLFTMKTLWISGRLALACLVCTLTLISLGCGNPVTTFQQIIAKPLALLASSPLISHPAAPVKNSDDKDAEATPTFPPAEDLVKDWDKPDVALFVTGRLHGYIEPCGCTGLDKQKGGLLRRRTCQKILLNRGWDLVNIDAGNQIRRKGQQAKIKLGTTYDALCNQMGYHAIGLGVDDIEIPWIDLMQTIFNVVDDDNPFICANVSIADAEDTTNKYKVIQQNGMRLGVTAVIGNEHMPKLKNLDGLKKLPVADGLKQVAGPLVAEKCDLNILVAQSDPATCVAIAKKFPIFDVLITSGGAGDPKLQPDVIRAGNHTTSIIQVGVKGMYAGIVGIYKTPKGMSLKYERVPMDARFEDAIEMRKVFKNYQEELKLLWQSGQFEDIKPKLHPSGHKYVGSAACADCHEEEYEIWEEGIDGNGGPHAKATADLTDPGERTWVKRNFDPECVSCHAVGWDPQRYVPFQTGFLDLEKHDHLHGNGCENCHGPGSAHVDSEENGDEDEALRKEMIVTKAEAEANLCLSCHDLDNSPDYALDPNGFEKFWPTIAHGGDDDDE